MATLGARIAVLVVLVAGIHPGANGLDPTWIDGLYDDADSDTLISGVRAASQVLPADLTLRVPRVARVPSHVGAMKFVGQCTPTARPFFRFGTRGPPHSSEFGQAISPVRPKRSLGSSRPKPWSPVSSYP